jgi:hypothetical protein
VRGAVDVGVFVLVEIGEAVDDGLRLLRGGGVVEPDERAAVDLLAKDGEVALGVERDRTRGSDRAGRSARCRRALWRVGTRGFERARSIEKPEGTVAGEQCEVGGTTVVIREMRVERQVGGIEVVSEEGAEAGR